ncbi:hypothetical protein [Agathobaculum sp. Marseille-P7918]|uniref:hypothetical protein n=1 Tax=Agathobaculum sp. Marseille-P7918 TaxID=2479843 RepID=UPI0035614094
MTQDLRCGQYEDIIHLPHPISKTRPQMPMSDRAAQFSPFAALTGYDAAIRETARLTDKNLVLDEETCALLDRKQQHLCEIIAEKPEITVTCFVPDERKDGGSYATVIGKLKRIDLCARLVLTDGRNIPLDDIADLESERFDGIV